MFGKVSTSQTSLRASGSESSLGPANVSLTQLVADALRYHQGQRFDLSAWVVMPNHVHAVIELLSGASLGEIVGSRKSYTARRANRIVGSSGAFWHADYFDRYMRDETQLQRTIDYVENNPVKAGLAKEPADWPWSSAC